MQQRNHVTRHLHVSRLGGAAQFVAQKFKSHGHAAGAAENFFGRGSVNHEQTFDTGTQGLRLGASLARQLLRQARGLEQAGQRQGAVMQGRVHGQVWGRVVGFAESARNN